MKRLVILLLLSLLFTAPTVTVYAQTPAPPAAGAQVDINSATAEQLQAIKGIGPVYAKKIIEGRPYAKKDQLVSRGILPQGIYDKLKDQLIAKQKK